MTMTPDTNQLHIFIEARRRKTFVGTLEKTLQNTFIFCYDNRYLMSEAAIPLGVDIPLSKQKHEAKQLFASFKDRLPSKNNPAYLDYCKQRGVSPTETNVIILLGSIGKRGPSSFIFEPIIIDSYNVQNEINKFKSTVKISIKDIALVFGINYVTLYKITKGQSLSSSTAKLVRIYLTHPDCLIEQLKFSSSLLHYKVLENIIHFIEGKVEKK